MHGPRQVTVDRYAFVERVSVTATLERMTFKNPQSTFWPYFVWL